MKREINAKCSRYLRAAICLFLLMPVTASFGQSPVAENGSPKKKLRLAVSDSGAISLQAKQASAAALADELNRRLKIPVVLSNLMREQTVNLTIDDLPLEDALRELASHARVDYILSQSETGKLMKRPLAIYLSGYNEPEPTIARNVENEPLAVVIEGNTETVNEPTKGNSLQINFADNLLTVSARRQNLSFLISEIAARANLEFDLRYDCDCLVNIEIQNEPLIEALARLSPQVQIYLRHDLLTEKTTVFRVALVEPKKPIKTNR